MRSCAGRSFTSLRQNSADSATPCVPPRCCTVGLCCIVLLCTMYSATGCSALCNETNQAEILLTSPFWRSAHATDHLAIVEYLSIQLKSGFLIFYGEASMDFLAKGCCLQQLIERKMIICCQGSVGCRLRHDLAADPCSTQYPPHEARAGWREREIGQRMGSRARTQLLGSPSRRFIQSDKTCSPSIPIQVFELAPSFVLKLYALFMLEIKSKPAVPQKLPESLPGLRKPKIMGSPHPPLPARPGQFVCFLLPVGSPLPSAPLRSLHQCLNKQTGIA